MTPEYCFNEYLFQFRNVWFLCFHCLVENKYNSFFCILNTFH